MRLCFAKRPKGRSIFAAPVGALCEKSPPIRPNLVVAPTGAARRRLGFAFALQTPLQFRFPPRRGAMRAKSPMMAELCVAPPLVRPLGSPTARGIPSARGRLLRWLRLPLICASRGLRLFSRQVGSTRTLWDDRSGRENRSPRWGIFGTRPRTMTGRGAARCGFASAAGR